MGTYVLLPYIWNITPITLYTHALPYQFMTIKNLNTNKIYRHGDSYEFDFKYLYFGSLGSISN